MVVKRVFAGERAVNFAFSSCIDGEGNYSDSST